MAQPIIVAEATTESCAAVGPIQDHGARSYSPGAAGVKLPRPVIGAGRVHWGEGRPSPRTTARAAGYRPGSPGPCDNMGVIAADFTKI